MRWTLIERVGFMDHWVTVERRFFWWTWKERFRRTSCNWYRESGRMVGPFLEMSLERQWRLADWKANGRLW